MDTANERRLLDCAVLIGTHALANEIPDGISQNGDYLTIRRGPMVFIWFAPHKWARQLLETVGQRAFIAAATEEGGPSPQTFARAHALIHVPNRGVPKLIRFYVPERIRHLFARDRTPRMRLDVSRVERLETSYGTLSNKLGRPEASAHAVA